MYNNYTNIVVACCRRNTNFFIVQSWIIRIFTIWLMMNRHHNAWEIANETRFVLNILFGRICVRTFRDESVRRRTFEQTYIALTKDEQALTKVHWRHRHQAGLFRTTRTCRVASRDYLYIIYTYRFYMSWPYVNCEKEEIRALTGELNWKLIQRDPITWISNMTDAKCATASRTVTEAYFYR